MSETEAGRKPPAAYRMLHGGSGGEPWPRADIASHEQTAQIIATRPSEGEM